MKRSWWIWPLGQAVWLLIDNLHWSFQYTQFPAIQNSAPFWFLNFLVVVAGITIQTSKVIRDAVLRTLRTDEIRCESCEYLLRGIDSDHCPECGTQRQPLNMLRYGVRFARGPRLSLKSQLVRIFLAAAMLMAPIWVPLTLSYTTLAVSPYVPEWMKPGWRVFMNDRNQIPVRYGLTYLIRHGKEVATLHAFAASPFRTRYEARYWKDGSQFATATPDTIESGQLKVGISAIEIGPWTFRGSPCQSMMWLTRPDDSFSVTGFEHEPR